MAEQDFAIGAKIGADTDGFEDAINVAIESINIFSNDIDSLGQSINNGCKSWGVDFESLASSISDTTSTIASSIESSMTPLSEFEEKLLNQKLEFVQAENQANLDRLQNTSATVEEIAEVERQGIEEVLSLKLQQIDNMEALDIQRASKAGASEKEINNIHTYYANERTKINEEANKKIEESFSNSGNVISNGLANWGVDLNKFYSTGSNVFSQLGINIDKFASKFGMSGPVIAGITAVTVAMTKFGQQINGAFAEITKGTGATGEALEGLKEDARKSLVNGIGQDIETVSVMIANLNTRFGVSGDELQDLTDTFDMFAQVTGADAKESINDVADVMAKWKIETEDTGALLDQLTKASQDSGASVNELMSGLKTGQSVFSQFGMSATQSIAYMSQLAKSGIETETALQGMKTALAKFANEGLNVEEAMKETAEAIKNASSNTEALQIATSVFGNRAGPEMVQVFKNGADSIEDYTKALTEAGGKLEETHELSRTSKNAMAELINSLEGTFAGFGQGFDTLFRDILDTITNFVKFLEPV